MSKVTINMDVEFVKWWKTLAPHIQEDEVKMIVAWWAWQKGQQVLKEGR